MKTKIFNLDQKIEESILNSSEINFLDSIGMYIFGKPVPECVLNKVLDNYSLNKLKLNSFEAKKQTINYLTNN